MMNSEYKSTGVLISIVFLFYIKQGQMRGLEFTPSGIILNGPNPTRELNISCSRFNSILSIVSIQLSKKLPSGGKSFEHHIRVNPPGALHTTTKTEGRTTIVSFINGSMGYMHAILKDLQCSDAGRYHCQVNTSDDTTTNSSYGTAFNVTAHTFPEDLKLSVTPDESLYLSNAGLNFTCAGKVGSSIRLSMSAFWMWEWSHVDSDETRWTRFPNTGPVRYYTSPTMSDCQYTGSSSLIHTITVEDHGRRVRCRVLNEEFSANTTLYVRGQTARLTTSQKQASTDGVNPASELTIACSPNAPGQPEVLLIEVGKKASNGTNIPMVKIQNGNVVFESSNLVKRMNNTIVGTSGRLEVVPKEFRSSGVTIYYCITSYTDIGPDEITLRSKAEALLPCMTVMQVALVTVIFGNWYFHEPR